MADVKPLKALHYDLGKVGGLDRVASPPYDVIDAGERRRLLDLSPYNAVAIDLPKPFDPEDPASRPVGDPYEDAARRVDAWRAEGVGALAQEHPPPDGTAHPRHGVLVRVRVEDYETGTVRPHERTHPGPLV